MIMQMLVGLVGGVGLFLFGMQMMASGMQKTAGDKLRHLLEVLTSKPIIGVLTGTAATLLIQSSTTTTIMVVGFVNAGLMGLQQAAGTIIGANIGTTITAQIISFKLDVLALPAIGLGAVLNYFGRRRLYKYLGQTVLGFGLLFLGLKTMSASMEPLQANPFFLNLLVSVAEMPIMGVLVGALFTALIQSSSAFTGIVIALALKNLITLEAAAPLVLGSNIGTCVPPIIASMGTNLSARRTVMAHLMFNITGVILVLIFFRPFMTLINSTAQSVPRLIANAHTIFNVSYAVILLPFLNKFVKLIIFLIPGEETIMEMGPKYLDKRILKTPAIAIGGARQEIMRMGCLAREMVDESVNAFLNNDHKKINHILQSEDLVDDLEKEITVYLVELSQHSLSRTQSQYVQGLMHAISDLERIGDHAQNIVILTENKVEDKLPFSEVALQELHDFYRKVSLMLEKAMRAFEGEDYDLAKEVIEEDDVVDYMERVLRKHHIQRINEKTCYPPAGVIYLDMLSNLERIADHATNIAQVVMGEF